MLLAVITKLSMLKNNSIQVVETNLIPIVVIILLSIAPTCPWQQSYNTEYQPNVAIAIDVVLRHAYDELAVFVTGF